MRYGSHNHAGAKASLGHRVVHQSACKEAKNAFVCAGFDDQSSVVQGGSGLFRVKRNGVNERQIMGFI